MSKIAILTVLLLMLALGAFFRFYLITEVPLGLYPDEAMNGNNALEALSTGEFKIFYTENNGREGLFINILALSLWVFGPEPWALRLVSAIFGTLTILGVYLLTKELFREAQPQSQNSIPDSIGDKRQNDNSKFKIYDPQIIALLSAFFLAVSFWHVNFSRIGFRAILVPFFAAFGIYFLLKGLRNSKFRNIDISSLVWAGVFIGLGFHTYIAFRFVVFVIALPLGWYLWKWYRNKITNYKLQITNSCVPCAVLLFIFVTFVVALPIGWYFLQNPGDFLGRATGVSIFSAESPAWEFVKSNAKTLGMFFVPGVGGDCNWRHNFDCRPYLSVGVFGLAGIWALWRLREKRLLAFLAGWAFFMSLPATLTREGMPHALRSIGMVPPLIILEAAGAWFLLRTALSWFESQKTKWPASVAQLGRIRKELILLFLLLLAVAPLLTYRQYFLRWSGSPDTYFAFSTDIWHLGQYLGDLPTDTRKYVIVNLPGVDVRGIPMPAQTVMFATDTFRAENQHERNLAYYRGEDSLVPAIEISPQEHTVIAFLNGDDRGLIRFVQEKFPELKIKVPGDFVILTNQ